MTLTPTERRELEEETAARIHELYESFFHGLERYRNRQSRHDGMLEVLVLLQDIRSLGKLLSLDKVVCYCESFSDLIRIVHDETDTAYPLLDDWYRLLALQLEDLHTQLDSAGVAVSELDFSISEKPDLHYPETFPATRLKQLRVLVVEDEPEPRRAAVTFLQRRVKTVLEASDGEEGLALYRSEKPDIIITDLAMPKMNGLKMIRHIRHNNPYIPVIVTTAFEDRPYYYEASELVIHAYLVKPFELKSLEKELLALANLL